MNGKDKGGIAGITSIDGSADPDDEGDVMLSARIPKELRRALKLVSIQRGVPMAELVTDAVMRHLKKLAREEVSGGEA